MKTLKETIPKKKILPLAVAACMATMTLTAPISHAAKQAPMSQTDTIKTEGIGKTTDKVGNAKNKKAHKAYKKRIRKDQRKYCPNETLRYAYKDLNGDGIDELITYPGFGACTEILYTYKNGKAKKLISVAQGDFEKYYKKKKVLCYNGGHMDHYYEEYYKFKGSKLIKKAYLEESVELVGDEPVASAYYYVNGKSTTEQEYKSYVKQLTKGDKAKPFSKLNWKTY